jgi:hypothetical protein
MNSAKDSVMTSKKRIFPRRIVAILLGLVVSSPVFAYIGPGAGLSAIGSVLALIGALLLMILGFVWYPVKRMMASKKQDSPPPEEEMECSEVDESRQTSDVDINPAKQS